MTLLALWTTLQIGAQEPKPVLTVQDSAIVVAAASGKSIVSLKPAPGESKPSVMFRHDQTFAVWDQDRGLTVRKGKGYVYSTRLPDVAVTRKLFTPLEISETARLISANERTREAYALSGARRIGKDVYFLVRWEGKNKKPWLEALVKVDLTEDRPKPQLVGRFDGASQADKPLDDRMFLVDGTLGVVSRLGASWGIARFDPGTGGFSSLAIGEGLASYAALTSRVIMFMEDTPYGTSILGRADVGTGARRNLLEARGRITIVDKESPMIALVKNEGKLTLHNVETGAQVPGITGGNVRRTPQGLLHWFPADKPRNVMLYEPSRMEVLAKLDPASAPAPPPSRSGARPASGKFARPPR